MSENYGVEVIEVTDSLLKNSITQESADTTEQACSAKTSQQRHPDETPSPNLVPIEDLVTLFIETMTNLVELMVNTSKSVAEIMISKSRSITKK